MPEKSRFPPLAIPTTDLLTWLFPSEPSNAASVDTRSHTSPPSSRSADSPIWHDAAQPERSLSSAQLLTWVKRLGFGLQRLGVRDGEVVLIMSTNHIFIPVVYLGASGFGRVFSGVNPAYGVQETKFQIENTDAKVFLVEPLLLDVAIAAADKTGFPRERMFLFSDEECQTTHGVKDWRRMLGTEEESKDVRWRSLSAEEARKKVAVLNYSSGTTGMPKGVMISHENIIANVEQSLYMRALSTADASSLSTPVVAKDERWLGFLPLYHAFGQLWSIAAAARTRVPVYFMRAFDWRAWLSHVQNHHVTHIVTAPPILVMLAKRPEVKEYDLGSLRNILCGGAPLGRDLQNEVMGGVGTKGVLSVVQTCGATEATCSHMHVPGLMKDDSGSVGMVDPNCEVKLVDDDGKEAGEDARGEICIRGPNIALGYWRNEKATKESFDEEGYWHSGDVAVKKDGWYWIVDRKKELIKVKGFQVAPAELEAALLENEHVADAAVVALKMDHDERPRAYVMLKEHARGNVKENDVVEWMAKRVAKHKRLTGGVAFVDEVPKSSSGKIQRVVMRDWAARDAKQLEGSEAKAKL